MRIYGGGEDMSVLKRYIKEKACALFIIKQVIEMNQDILGSFDIKKEILLKMELLDNINRGK